MEPITNEATTLSELGQSNQQHGGDDSALSAPLFNAGEVLAGRGTISEDPVAVLGEMPLVAGQDPCPPQPQDAEQDAPASAQSDAWFTAAHQKYLLDRAVSLEVARKADLRSITDGKKVAKLVGWREELSGGIAIPYFDKDGRSGGDYGTLRVRLDKPVGDRKFLALPGRQAMPYLAPKGVVDSKDWLDETKPLVFVEGPVKALALVSHGVLAIGLGGTHAGFHDTEEWKKRHRLVPHSELRDRVTTKGRPIVIMMDAGRASNALVALGEARAALTFGTSQVKVAALPERDDGGDQGPDDYLAKHGIEALKVIIDAALPSDPCERAQQVADMVDEELRGKAALALINDLPFQAAVSEAALGVFDEVAKKLKVCGVTKGTLKAAVEGFKRKLDTRTERQKVDNQPGEESRYSVQEGRICAEKDEESVALANFDARILEGVTVDDGAEERLLFRVEGKHEDGSVLPTIDVPASEFSGMGWVLGKWGERAIVTAGFGAKDQLREAIQTLSKPTRRLVYAHTGWRKIGDEWSYLYHGGAIGADGVEVRLSAPLDKFVFSSLPSVSKVKEGIVVSLMLMKVAPMTVAVPILASTFLAPLAFILEPDFAIWLYGQTGNLKSELASLAQQHYGPFSRRKFPADWTRDTENSIEGRIFTMKDAVCVVDDYKPTEDARSQKEMLKKVGNIIRSIGNYAGRGRLFADLKQRPVRPPRGVIICTGESLPPGESTLARIVPVEVDRSKLILQKLTQMQRAAKLLPDGMRGYLEWLRPQIPEMQERLGGDLDNCRELFDGIGGHLRQPASLGSLYLGFDMFMRFAESIAVVTGTEGERYRDAAYNALVELGTQQGYRQKERDVGARFVDAIRGLLDSGRARLDAGETLLGINDVPRIGFIEKDHGMLFADATWLAVQRYFRDAGEHWAFSKADVYAALDRQFSLGRDSQGRLPRATLDDKQHRVLRVPLRLLSDSGEAADGGAPG